MGMDMSVTPQLQSHMHVQVIPPAPIVRLIDSGIMPKPSNINIHAPGSTGYTPSGSGNVTNGCIQNFNGMKDMFVYQLSDPTKYVTVPSVYKRPNGNMKNIATHYGTTIPTMPSVCLPPGAYGVSEYVPPLPAAADSGSLLLSVGAFALNVDGAIYNTDEYGDPHLFATDSTTVPIPIYTGYSSPEDGGDRNPNGVLQFRRLPNVDYSFDIYPAYTPRFYMLVGSNQTFKHTIQLRAYDNVDTVNTTRSFMLQTDQTSVYLQPFPTITSITAGNGPSDSGAITSSASTLIALPLQGLGLGFGVVLELWHAGRCNMLMIFTLMVNAIIILNLGPW